MENIEISVDNMTIEDTQENTTTDTDDSQNESSDHTTKKSGFLSSLFSKGKQKKSMDCGTERMGARDIIREDLKLPSGFENSLAFVLYNVFSKKVKY